MWVIDAKLWRGKIEYKSVNPLSVETRLFVGGKDRTSEVEKIYSMVIPVAQAIGDNNVPVIPALVFVDGNWSIPATARLIAKKHYQHLGVWITPPRILCDLIRREVPRAPFDVASTAARLDRLLPPR